MFLKIGVPKNQTISFTNTGENVRFCKVAKCTSVTLLNMNSFMSSFQWIDLDFKQFFIAVSISCNSHFASNF